MQFKIDGLFEQIGLKRSKTIGIALGGGGAKGFSHIGVLMAMEEFGIKPDIISGVSAGSIAAVLYASGLSPLEIRECFIEANKFDDFTEWTIPKDGIFKLDKFAKLLDSWLTVKNLEELKIPTIVCATNLTRGTQVGWRKGEIVPRVIASCSIPVVFKPVRINNEYYVDGGILHNLPAWAIRDDCDILFGSNCSPLDRKYRYRNSILDIAMRSFQLGMKANVIHDMSLCDYMIKPKELSQTKIFDLKSLNQNVNIGYESACRILDEIKNKKSGLL